MTRKNLLKKTINLLVEKTVRADSKKTSCSLIYQPPFPTELKSKKK